MDIIDIIATLDKADEDNFKYLYISKKDEEAFGSHNTERIDGKEFIELIWELCKMIKHQSDNKAQLILNINGKTILDSKEIRKPKIIYEVDIWSSEHMHPKAHIAKLPKQNV